ncbi:MAG: hypothetical protein ACOX1S_11035 [Anaerostipes sp.]|jgi:hypothetical protein
MKVKILLVCFFCFAITGCQKMNSVETYDYVLAMGVEDIGNNYLYHYSVADTSKITDNGGIKVPSKTVTIHAKDFQKGKKIWEQRKGRPLNFSQLKLIVLKPMDKKVVKALSHEREISKSVDMVTTKKEMKKLFGVEKKLPISFGEYMQQVLAR